MTLILTEVTEPEFSVVMVTHGAWDLTEQALSAVTRTAAGRFELVVVDNASRDATRVRLEELRGAKVILNETNRGFGPATNQGAELAQAPYLLLLNPDAFVHPGWLEPLLEAIRMESVGAAVPRYLHPSGSLQDAGPVLARDGTVAIYGDGESANRLLFRFRRVVDYGSAACMLIRRSAFAAIGGFDGAYAPAYYEDVDLCLRLAERGFCVVYEPRSTVTHVRYGSGTTENAVILSERNRMVFLDRWRSRLTGRPRSLRPPTEGSVLGARDAPATPRVLIYATACDTAAGRLAAALLSSWPRARVTWVTHGPVADHGGADRWLNKGVELLDPTDDPSWADNRMLHYDVVVLGDGVEKDAQRVLAESQPQAGFMPLSTLSIEDDELSPRAISDLATLGIAPPR